jgi:hypothetical protein
MFRIWKPLARVLGKQRVATCGTIQRSAEDAETILIYTHIPKTGGTSVLEVFRENIPPERLVYTEEEIVTGLLFKILNRDLQAIFGHIEYGVHEVVEFYKNVTYCTFVRDPIKRVISEYYYYRKHAPDSKMHKDLQSVPTVEDWFTSPHRPRNWQTNILCGYGNPRVIDSSLAIDHIYNDYCFVGILEHMEESVRRMCETLNFDHVPSPLPRKKEASNKPAFDERFYDRLRDLFHEEDRHDHLLYEAARNRFLDSLDKQPVRGGINAASARLAAPKAPLGPGGVPLQGEGERTGRRRQPGKRVRAAAGDQQRNEQRDAAEQPGDRVAGRG